MMKKRNKLRLMTEITYYILLSLVEPLHGYAAMKNIEEMSQGTVVIGAGTMYTAFSTLSKEGLIKIVDEDDRRKFYQITQSGKIALLNQIRKLSIMVEHGQNQIKKLT